MYKYQTHLTRHQRYINNVYVIRWFKTLNVINDDEVIDWLNEHTKEMHDMMVALG